MQIRFFAPHWGSNDMAPGAFIDKVLAAGFDGIEMSLPLDAAARGDWTARIRDAGLLLIAQQWETVFDTAFEAHRESLARHLENACAARPLFVNSHTGKDFYSFEQNMALVELAESIGRAHGVPVRHEIHRSRFSGHPMLLLPYLRALPQLELTADLSHWCCACESLLEDQPATLAETFPHVRHIHARVGHPQGPQASDFRSPEWHGALYAHLQWWDRIVALRREAGATLTTITPEFGPQPYTQVQPYTGVELANAWELNVAMLALLRERYGMM